jgi:pheromone shutdown-related protein TraB
MEIKIVGTSHISKDSVKEIKHQISEFKPDIVCVELDVHRYKSLFNKTTRKIKLSQISKLGLFGFLFYLIGSISQKVLSRKVGSKPGIDMRAAIIEAKRSNAKVALIDQDISITLRNLSKQVPFPEKLKLFGYILFGSFVGKKRIEFDLKSVPKDALIKTLVSELKHKFPNFYKVLVKDRDKYMQKQVKVISEKFPKSKILVVVGAGHKSSLIKFVSKL